MAKGLRMAEGLRVAKGLRMAKGLRTAKGLRMAGAFGAFGTVFGYIRTRQRTTYFLILERENVL